jgi:hypothetical protein
MQGTADFHYDITDALLPQVDPVFDEVDPGYETGGDARVLLL